MSEEPILCPECGMPMTLAPGIDWFCTKGGCERRKMIKTLASDEVVVVTMTISKREYGGIRIRCAHPHDEIYLAGKSDSVFKDLGVVIRTILMANHGHDWLGDEE